MTLPKPSPSASLPEGLADTLSIRLGAPLAGVAPKGASAWAQTFAIQAGDDRYFLKTFAMDDLAQREAQGLLALKKSKTVRVPEVTGWGPRYLILEWIDTGPVDWPLLGRRLADLHRHGNRVFGWHERNYLACLPQYNGVRPRWGAFFSDQRMASQLRLARERQSLSAVVIERLERFLPQLAKRVEVKEKPALVHGDLWHGNVLALPDGTPVLIDPAVSYSSREMDLAMSDLFGGFPESFHAAYQEAFPLSAGYLERKPLLSLYYLLAHANLFGAPYPARIEQVLETVGA